VKRRFRPSSGRSDEKLISIPFDDIQISADGDELYYVQSGSGTLESIFGPMSYHPGDYLLIPRGCIYRVGSRPSWNTWYTPLQFGFTAAVLGPLFAGAIGVGDARWLGGTAAALGVAQLVLVAVRFLRLIAADCLELRGTARLLSTVLRRPFVARGALLVAGAIVLPLVAGSAGEQPWLFGGRAAFAAALAVTLASEIAGRYLFFVSVVPMHLTAPYVASVREAA